MRRMIDLKLTVLILILTILSGQEVFAQLPPYDNAPAANPPYYRVRYEGSNQPGELLYPVAYTVWVPPAVEQLHGVIVHQHGCGEGSCKSGQTGAFDWHWQALALKHNCALISPAYEQPDGTDCQRWCDPRNGSASRFQTALNDLGLMTGHPELASVPLALWGHSGGGHWAGGMVLTHPERVAAAWLRSGVPLFTEIEGRNISTYNIDEKALHVPIMCNPGTKEGVSLKDGRFAGVWPANEAFFTKLRRAGGLVGVAVDPLTSHECGNQRYLAIPWLDACLTARLPENVGDPLMDIKEEDGWLAGLRTDEIHKSIPVSYAEFTGEKSAAIWLPNETIAKSWKEYVSHTKVVDLTPPPAPTDLALENNILTWKAVADLESGIAFFTIEREGTLIANVGIDSTNRYGRPIFQGLQYSDTPAVPLKHMRYELPADQVGHLGLFTVRSVNTAGGVSD